MQPWPPDEFTEQLRQVGRQHYHDKHPFHRLMNEGRLNREQIRLWVANRFYYQKNIPIKDALLLARCPLREVRRRWVQRILDHDGTGDDPGGIEKWLRLGEAVGPEPRRPGERPPAAARRALRRGRLRELRRHAAVDRGRRLVADRAVRPAADDRAPGRLREALHLDRPGGPGLLPLPAAAGPARQRPRPVAGPDALPHPRGAGTGRGRPALQVRPAVRPARRAVLSLRRRRPGPSRHDEPGIASAGRCSPAHARYRWDELRRPAPARVPRGNPGAERVGRPPSSGSATAGRRTSCSPPWSEQFPDERSRRTTCDEFLERLAAERTAARCRRPLDPCALLAELTYRCPLKCPYCSNPLELRRYRDELDTATWQRVLAEAAALGVVQVHFSGGEPLVRRDLPELVAAGPPARPLHAPQHRRHPGRRGRARHGCRTAGLDALQISLLDARPDENDWLAGAASFDKKRRAVEAARRLGFPVTLNVVLHRHNLDRLEEIIDLAGALGRGPAGAGPRAVHRLGLPQPRRPAAARARRSSGPRRWSRRPATGWAGRPEIVHVLPDYFQPYPKACLHGWGRVFLTVAPDGAVLPCQTAREIPGLEFPNVRDASLDEIWFHAPVFQRFRGTDWMPEPCRSCDAARDRLRRLPLPGVPAHRRPRRHRPGLLPVPFAPYGGGGSRRRPLGVGTPLLSGLLNRMTPSENGCRPVVPSIHLPSTTQP